MRNRLYIIVAGLLLCLNSCKEEGRLDHLDNGAPAPGLVSDVKIKNLPGGAVLRYKIPADDNFLYVKAVYQTSPRQIRVAKASLYMDSLVLEGYGATGTYPVELFSVGKNEKVSKPYQLEISPLAPSVELSFPTLRLEESFGGIRIAFKNEQEANLSITLLVDTLGKGIWNTLQTFYTKAPEGTFSYIGLDAVKTRFAVYLKDRWDNRSDTLVRELTPIYEVKFEKPYGQYNLPSDTYEPVEGAPGYRIDGLWDNITSNPISNIFATKHTSPMPQTFTFDLKSFVTVSRIKVHQRRDNEYIGCNVKKFQLYGSHVEKPGDDLFGGDWIILGEFESWKPSGTGSSITQEDKNYANVEGENFELRQTENVPNPWIPVRYIRFRSMETYNGPSTTGQITIAEISLYGQVQK